MRFYDAVNYLKQGKKIAAKQWDKRSYLQATIIELTNEVVNIKYYSEVFNPYTYENDIILENDWCVYKECDTTYSFYEMLLKLKEHKKITKKSWEKYQYIFTDGNKNLVFRTMEERKFVVDFDTLLNSEWELVDEN